MTSMNKFSELPPARRPKCPDCAGGMKLRNGKYGKFWGCNNFPNCRGTRNGDYMLSEDNYGSSPVEQVKDVVVTIKDDISINTKTALAEAKKRKEFVPSKYQQDIYDWMLANMVLIETTGQGKHLVIRAGAGTGKTTTGLQMLAYTKGLDVLFCAFNKAIQMTLAVRAPKHVTVKTFHALGFAACRKAFDVTFDDIDNSKLYKLFKDTVDYNVHKHLYPPVKQLISLVKANLTGVTVNDLQGLVDYYGIDVGKDVGLIFELVKVIYNKSVQMTSSIDFDDMCYLPVFYDLPLHEYDLVFIDESQDINKNQTDLIMKSVKPTGTIVAVGDDYQSMYGYRGANVDSIKNLIDNLAAEELPLSLTYRCPKSHVRYINKNFPEIPFEMFDGNDEGKILYWSLQDALLNWKEHDMVLCRTNAPLIQPCFALIRKGIKATIRGRDIGKGLIDLICKMEAIDIIDLVENLSDYEYREVTKLLALGKKQAAANLRDTIATIFALSEGVFTIRDLENRINTVFKDNDTEGVIFSTVHKAKGLEAEHVSILEPGLMPHPAASQDWELLQERNIEYVALTRSKNTLVFVS